MQLITSRQISFIKVLLAERDTTEIEAALTMAREATVAGTFTSKRASAFIDVLLSCPKVTRLTFEPSTREVAPEGMHLYHGTVYKVVEAKNGTGRRYAKALEHHDGSWSFVFAPGVVSSLSAATLMTAEDASQFGALYGVYCNCGRALTDETSIHFGYGPVCARNGWDYAKVSVLAERALTMAQDA